MYTITSLHVVFTHGQALCITCVSRIFFQAESYNIRNISKEKHILSYYCIFSLFWSGCYFQKATSMVTHWNQIASHYCGQSSGTWGHYFLIITPYSASITPNNDLLFYLTDHNFIHILPYEQHMSSDCERISSSVSSKPVNSSFVSITSPSLPSQ